MTVAEVSHAEQIAMEARATIAGMKVNECWAEFSYARLPFHTLMIGVTACVSLFATQGSLVAQTPTIHVLVLDALDGKPQANVKVKPLCTGLPRNFPEETAFTNDEGIATISYACGTKQVIEIAVFPPNKKEQCGGDAGMTFNDVVSAGFLSKPDSAGGIWCPTKVNKKLKPVPGQAIIFVKKPTWWQSHIAG
ncbi:MAG TPA: hypothetical protein VFU68_08775 [Terracidiphilus sp.]|nr:hypothetical protein [Terracidiphilus sp.]